MGLDARAVAHPAQGRRGAVIDVPEITEILRDSPGEVARLWRDTHLAAVPVDTDREAVQRAHRRSEALLVALARALSSESPEDWGGFSHREAVQIATMMAWSLAEAGATPAASAALFPCLVVALEELGLERIATHVAPLASVAAEGFAASLLSRRARQEQRGLVSATPVLSLPGATIVVAATGSPSVETAGSIADRATDLALDQERPWVIVDLSHLGAVEAGALAALVGLAADVERLEGKCLFVGFSDERRKIAEGAGVDVATLEVRAELAGAVSEALGRRGILGRIKNKLR